MKNKLKRDKTMYATTVVCLLPIILSIILYSRLPDQVAIHWNAAGEADNYTSKAIAAFGLPVFMAILNVILCVILENDPKKENASRRLRQFSQWCIAMLSVALVPITLFKSLGVAISIEVIVPILVGIVFIVCGNYLPKCKQNYTVGIKLPWTLDNEENWNKTHHLAGYLWIAGGMVMMVSAFFKQYSVYITLLVVICVVVIPTIYSYFFYRRNRQIDKK